MMKRMRSIMTVIMTKEASRIGHMIGPPCVKSSIVVMFIRKARDIVSRIIVV